MIKKTIAIGFIFVCASIAWAVLGGTMLARTYSSDSSLKTSVERIWGSPQSQAAPVATYPFERTRKERSEVDGTTVTKLVNYTTTHELDLAASDVKVKLALDHRQKGLLWYATYVVDFAGAYQFRNDSGEDRYVTITLPFPSQSAIYDGFSMTVRERSWRVQPEAKGGQVQGRLHLRAGEAVTVDIAYRSQGMDRWSYRFAQNEHATGIHEVKNFRLEMQTDFESIDFPEDSVSPTRKERIGEGWRLTWQYGNLIAGVNIGVLMPQKLQPGPLAGKISFFAPVSLFFFIVAMLAITLVRGVELHPMHFFFLSGAFFAFHLLLAYLVDHVSIHAAFAAASVVSIALVVSYLRLVVGRRFAFVEAATAQLIYLVLFSYAFFFKGFTGLTVTVGAILTLFVLMQMTARIRWSEVFAKRF